MEAGKCPFCGAKPRMVGKYDKPSFRCGTTDLGNEKYRTSYLCDSVCFRTAYLRSLELLKRARKSLDGKNKKLISDITKELGDGQV